HLIKKIKKKSLSLTGRRLLSPGTGITFRKVVTRSSGMECCARLAHDARSPVGLYVDRVAGGHRDHRRPGGDVAPGRPGSARVRASDGLSESSPPDRARRAAILRRLEWPVLSPPSVRRRRHLPDQS